MSIFSSIGKKAVEGAKDAAENTVEAVKHPKQTFSKIKEGCSKVFKVGKTVLNIAAYGSLAATIVSTVQEGQQGIQTAQTQNTNDSSKAVTNKELVPEPASTGDSGYQPTM